jgi:hypothetical protein
MRDSGTLTPRRLYKKAALDPTGVTVSALGKVAWAVFVSIIVLPATVAGPLIPATSAHPGGSTGVEPQVAELDPAAGVGGGFVVNGAIIFVGFGNWLGNWQSAPNGSETYASAVILECYDIVAYGNVTLELSLFEVNYGWVQNTTVILPITRAEVDVQLTFHQDVHWETARVYFDGGPVFWQGQAATPVSLLPPGILNIGGLDLFIMAILSFVVVTFSLGAWLSWRIMRRALLAPPFSLLMWGHVFLAVMVGTIIVDYQWIDATFAGWSPVFYPIPIALMFFFFTLSLHNRRERKEAIQFLPQAGTEVLARRTFVSWGVTRSGVTVLLRETWGDFWARAFGHFCPLIQPGEEGKPLELKIVRGISPTRTGRKGKPPRPRRYVRQSIAQIRVINPQDDDTTSYVIVDGREPLEAEFPRLRWTRLKHHEARTLRNGEVRPAFDRRGISGPHYEPEQGSAKWTVKRDFWVVALAVLAGWASVDDLAELYRRAKTALAIAESHRNAEVEREVTRRLGALLSVPEKVAENLPVDTFPTNEKKNAAGGG